MLPEIAADPTSGQEVTFNEKTTEALVKANFQNERTKLSSDALKIMNEIIRVHALEILNRAAEQAKTEGSEEVSSEHFEKVLPQFLLDFA